MVAAALIRAAANDLRALSAKLDEKKGRYKREDDGKGDHDEPQPRRAPMMDSVGRRTTAASLIYHQLHRLTRIEPRLSRLTKMVIKLTKMDIHTD
jgi:hypothetical protein